MSDSEDQIHQYELNPTKRAPKYTFFDYLNSIVRIYNSIQPKIVLN